MKTEHDKLLKENEVKKGKVKYHWGGKIQQVQTLGWKKTDQLWISQVRVYKSNAIQILLNVKAKLKLTGL